MDSAGIGALPPLIDLLYGLSATTLLGYLAGRPLSVVFGAARRLFFLLTGGAAATAALFAVGWRPEVAAALGAIGALIALVLDELATGSREVLTGEDRLVLFPAESTPPIPLAEARKPRMVSQNPILREASKPRRPPRPPPVEEGDSAPPPAIEDDATSEVDRDDFEAPASIEDLAPEEPQELTKPKTASKTKSKTKSKRQSADKHEKRGTSSSDGRQSVRKSRKRPRDEDAEAEDDRASTADTPAGGSRAAQLIDEIEERVTLERAPRARDTVEEEDRETLDRVRAAGRSRDTLDVVERFPPSEPPIADADDDSDEIALTKIREGPDRLPPKPAWLSAALGAELDALDEQPQPLGVKPEPSIPASEDDVVLVDVRDCPNCGTQNPERARFCKQCSRPVQPWTCESCGFRNDVDATFCMDCREPLQMLASPLDVRDVE